MAPLLMNFTAVLLLSIFVPYPILGFNHPWNNLRVKWTPLFQGLYKVPLSTHEIKDKEYVFLKHHEEFPKVSIYCYPDDPRVCAFYDKDGGVAGLRASFIIKNLHTNTKKGKEFKPEMIYKKPFYKKSSAFNETFYYRDVLFVNPDKLKEGGLKDRKEPVGDGVYLNLDGKTWTSIPREESKVESKTLFKKQACFPGMGMHYFYNLTPQMKCEDNQPVFLLYHNEELVGLGLQGFGADKPKDRSWFESVPPMAIKMITPKRPDCLTDWVKDFGLLSLHIFFQPRPVFNCVFQSS